MKFECGCSIEKLDFENITLECPATWDMIGKGLTKGVFQLEESLGRQWAKKIKPRNLRELSDVISLIRPGCLDAEFREDPNTGKMLNISDSYVRTRNGELEAEYLDSSLEPILKDSYGVPIYQEQLMEICKEFAGFSLQEADDTRKAIGKKDKVKMAKLESKFIDGSKKRGHPEEMAKSIFGWINKFSSYGFNLSHGICYALNAYRTAYAKVHFPIEFFKNMLAFSDSKIDSFDEIKQLVYEARLFNIDIIPPTVKSLNMDFAFVGDNKLAFGLAHIKNVGESSLAAIRPLANINSEAELLSHIFLTEPKKKKKQEELFTDASIAKGKQSIKSNALEALIKCGALDFLTKSRIGLLARYKMLNEMTDLETRWLIKEDKIALSTSDWINELEINNIPRKGRIEKLKTAREAIVKEYGGNHFKMKLGYEKFHLGMALSGSEVDLYHNEHANTTCRDFLRLKSGSEVAIAAILESVSTKKDKNGNWMAFLSISDNTYMLDSVLVFSSSFNKVSWILEEGKAVLLKGRKKDVSLFVNSIEHL